MSARRRRHQDAQLVGRLATCRFQGRDACLGLSKVRLALRHVQLGRGAVVELHLRQVQADLLVLDVLAGIVQPLLGRPHVNVALGDLGEQQHQGVVVVVDRSLQLRIGRFQGAAIKAPEVELPGQVRAHGPVVVMHQGSGAGAIPADLLPRVAAGGLLRLRKEGARRDVALGRASTIRKQAMRNERFWRYDVCTSQSSVGSLKTCHQCSSLGALVLKFGSL